jgi:hypothetical protein
MMEEKRFRVRMLINEHRYVYTPQKMSNKGQNKEFHQKLSKNLLKSIILAMMIYEFY